MHASMQAAGSMLMMEVHEGAIQGLWQDCIEAAQTLHTAKRDKNFYDPAVRAVRTRLRTAFEAFLLHDYDAAQVTTYKAMASV